MPYSLHRVPVRGGRLTVGEWRPERDVVQPHSYPTIIALHGLTSNHRAWSFLADAAPGARILAIDLRGRGGSAELPGPYSLEGHVDDVLDVVSWFGAAGSLVVGHSLGAFVAMLAGRSETGAFSAALLVDGGLPLAVPLAAPWWRHVGAVGSGVSDSEAPFASETEYRRFWRSHPALSADWNRLHEDYCDYEIVRENGRVRWTANPVAVERDEHELFGTVRFRAALDDLAMPVTLVAATRGLFDEEVGIYSERQLAQTRAAYPDLRVVTSTTNHLTSVLSVRGAALLAHELRLLAANAELLDPDSAQQRRDVMPTA